MNNSLARPVYSNASPSSFGVGPHMAAHVGRKPEAIEARRDQLEGSAAGDQLAEIAALAGEDDLLRFVR